MLYAINVVKSYQYQRTCYCFSLLYTTFFECFMHVLNKTLTNIIWENARHFCLPQGLGIRIRYGYLLVSTAAYTYRYLLVLYYFVMIFVELTKTTAAQNKVALSYYNVRGLHFLAVVFVVRTKINGTFKWYALP